jgi:hypothetical protein
MHQIWDFDVFQETKNPCIEKAPIHVVSIWISNTQIFEMSSLLSKNGLYLWISGDLTVENKFFLNVPYLLWVWEFVNMYLIHLDTRIKSYTTRVYSKKVFFWPPKLCCPPLALGKKNSSTLKFTTLQMVKNECVRFGGHVDVQVYYKILW